jgi:hypothetical protein
MKTRARWQWERRIGNDCGEREEGRERTLHASGSLKADAGSPIFRFRRQSPAITGYPVEFSTWWTTSANGNVEFCKRGLSKSKAAAYNPPIAEERGAKRRRARKQTAEKQEQF